MRTISQRELRNDNAEIMRGVEEGETYVVTRRGVPIARIEQYREDDGLPLSRPATQPPRFSLDDMVVSSISSEEILADLRDNR